MMTKENQNEAQKIISGLQDVFNLTTSEGFKKIFDEAEKVDKKAASSGYGSTAASSGYGYGSGYGSGSGYGYGSFIALAEEVASSRGVEK